jgi:hypothetical protein
MPRTTQPLSKRGKSFDENLIIFQYMGSVMCRKICLEFARPVLMVKLGTLLLNKGSKTASKKRI